MIVYREKKTMMDDLMYLHEVDFSISRIAHTNYGISANARRYGDTLDLSTNYSKEVDLTQELSLLSSDIDEYVSSLGPLEVKVIPLDRVPFITDELDKAYDSFGLKEELMLYGGYFTRSDGSGRIKVLSTRAVSTNVGIDVTMLLLLKDNDKDILEVDLDQYNTISHDNGFCELARRELNPLTRATPEGYSYMEIRTMINKPVFHAPPTERSESYLHSIQELSTNSASYSHEELGPLFSSVFGADLKRKRPALEIDLELI